MSVLVSGGMGFIGNNICRIIDYDVIVFDKFISKNRVKSYINYGVILQGDICNTKKVKKIFRIRKMDYVIHLAAQVSVNKSVSDPKEDEENNISGLINILDMCKKYHLKKIVFSSSAAVYAPPENNPISEYHPKAPQSFYGLSKLTGEEYIKMYNKHFGLNYVILRYANVYGEGQNPEGEAGVITKFANQMLKNEDVYIYGDGNQTRDFIYVGDVAKATVKALDEDVKNVTMNISTGIETSINEIFQILKKELDYKKNPIYLPRKDGDIEKSCLDNTRMKSVLKYTPETDLQTGIKKYVEWLKSDGGDNV